MHASHNTTPLPIWRSHRIFYKVFLLSAISVMDGGEGQNYYTDEQRLDIFLNLHVSKWFPQHPIFKRGKHERICQIIRSLAGLNQATLIAIKPSIYELKKHTFNKKNGGQKGNPGANTNSLTPEMLNLRTIATCKTRAGSI